MTDFEKGRKEKRMEGGDFPGGPVVKTPHFHCRGTGSIPGWGTKIPRGLKKIKNKKKGWKADLDNLGHGGEMGADVR